MLIVSFQSFHQYFAYFHPVYNGKLYNRKISSCLKAPSTFSQPVQDFVIPIRLNLPQENHPSFPKPIHLLTCCCAFFSSPFQNPYPVLPNHFPQLFSFPSLFFSHATWIILINFKFDRKTMMTTQGQERRLPLKSKRQQQQPFFYLLSQLRFFGFKSTVLTVLLFAVWNFPLLKIMQMFINNNPKVQDYYITSLFTIAKYLFTFEQYASLDFVDKNYQNNNFMNLLVFILLGLYCLLFAYIFLSLRKANPKVSTFLISVLRAFTLIIYLLSFYFYLIAGTALIKDIRASIYKYIPFAIFNLILTFIIIFVIENRSNQNQYQSPLSLSVVNNPQHVAGQLAKLVLAGVLAAKDYFADRNLFIILFSIASSIVLLVQLKSTLTSMVYLHSPTQRLHELFSINTLCTYIILLIYYFTNSASVINNCLFINITANILAMYSLKLYHEKRREWLFQDEGDESHEEGELAWKMIQYIMLLRAEGNVKYSFASLSVIRHVKECSNPTCFCEASKDRSTVELASDRAFLLQLVYLKLKNLIELNPQSFSLRMIGVNFKTIFQQSFTNIHTEFERVMKSCQPIEGTKALIAYQFRKEFQGRVMEETRQGNQIRLQELFEEQKFRDELVVELEEMGHRNVKKYSMLAQDYCSLNKLYTLSNLITSTIRNVQLKWAQFKLAETHNIRVLEVFLVYFECMLPSRLQTSEIKSLINKRLHSLRFLKGTDESTLNRAIYTTKATVLQTRFKGYDDIRIVNASANCSALLRRSSKELIGKEIHDVLPHYMVGQHKQLVEERLSQLVSLKHLDKVRPAFMVDLSGHCYSGKVHVRVSATSDELHFFVLLLKEDENNFVIMDDHLNIQGIGRRIQRQQIFYRQNLNTPILNFCNQDFLKLLTNRQSVKKSITITQMIKRVDTRSMIKCSNLDSMDEDDLKALFDMVSFQCQVDVAKHPLRNTVYYSIKFGELKKTLKISEKRSSQEFQKKLQSKLGTLIYVNHNSNPNHKKDPNRTIESDQDITQLQIENLSEDCIKGNIQDDNMLAINQTSSTASSLKDSESLSYSELMLRLKEYLLDMQSSPMFSVPMMKVFTIVCGVLLIVCGFVECMLIFSGVKSYSEIYEASTYVNNINQMMEVSLNNDEILQKYCNTTNFSSRCSYLNKTQSILHSQLYQLMATSMDGYLSTQTSLFGIRYYSALDTIVQVSLHDGVVEVSTREFLQLYYFSLKQVQNGGQTANSLQFLNNNWNLIQSVNVQSLDYYQQAGAEELQTLTEIIYAYTALFIVLVLCFALPFHIFLARCNARIESIIRLYQLVDIELCKRLMEVEKAIIPLISERYVERSFNSSENASTQNTKLQPKRYSQFTYHSDHYQKIIITVVFLVIIVLNAVTLANYLQYIPSSQSMQSSLNDLITSQNSAMQNYITIKMSLFNGASMPAFVPSASLMFVEDVKMVFSTFSSTDPTLSAQFNSLTMRDVCSYNKPFIQSWQLQRCNNFTTSILARGINSATSNLVRQTESAQNQYSSLTSSSYLSSSPFQDLDDQLIFQLAVYHQMKRITIESFNRSLSSFSASLQSNNYISAAFVGLAVLAGCWALRSKRRSLGNIFGIILQVPQRVFAEKKLVMKIVTQNLADQ